MNVLRRFPRVRQHDVTDCGAACLAAVAAYHGRRVPISRIRQLAATDERGTNLYGMITAAKAIGLEAKGVRAPPEALGALSLPAIAHLQLDSGLQHYVVLVRVERGRVRIMDPGDGTIASLDDETYLRRWTGVLLLLAPEPAFEAMDGAPGTFGRFWALVRPHRTILLQALLGAVVYTVLGLATAIYVQKVVDHVLVDGNVNLLNLLSVGMIAILLAQAFVGGAKSLFTLRTAQQIDATLIAGYYRHLMTLPQRFFDTMRVGEIVARVNDAVKIRAFINDVSLDLLVNALVVLFSVALIFTYSVPLAIGVVAVLPLYLVVHVVTNRVNRKVLREGMERGAELESHLVESIGAMATIRRYGLERRMTSLAETRLCRLLRPVYTSGKAAIGGGAASELISRLAVVGVLWGGAVLVLRSELSPGELMSVYALLGYLTGPATQLVAANRTVQDALIAGARLFEVLDLERDRPPGRATMKLPRERPIGIRWEAVSFRYGNRPLLFDRLSLEIPGGRVTALVGASGSGKSSIVSLCQGVHPIESGRIRIGGFDLEHLDREDLRKRFVIVPQEIHLFAGTVIENIAIDDPNPDMLRLLRICDRLGVSGFVDRLPAGFHTQIGENGVSLSGGQRQRLAIARALYGDPDILALDESTSSLDSRSETRVRAAIRALREEERTVLVVAHRLSSVIDADRIIVLEDGKVVEQGAHHELLAARGAYHALWTDQHPTLADSADDSASLPPLQQVLH